MKPNNLILSFRNVNEAELTSKSCTVLLKYISEAHTRVSYTLVHVTDAVDLSLGHGRLGCHVHELQ